MRAHCPGLTCGEGTRAVAGNATGGVARMADINEQLIADAIEDVVQFGQQTQAGGQSLTRPNLKELYEIQGRERSRVARASGRSRAVLRFKGPSA